MHFKKFTKLLDKFHSQYTNKQGLIFTWKEHRTEIVYCRSLDYNRVLSTLLNHYPHANNGRNFWSILTFLTLQLSHKKDIKVTF